MPRRRGLQRDSAVVPQPQALLREGWARHISAQALQACPVIGRHPHGVQVEAIQMRLPGPARDHALEIGLRPEAPHPRPRARAQRRFTVEPLLSSVLGGAIETESRVDAGPR